MKCSFCKKEATMMTIKNLDYSGKYFSEPYPEDIIGRQQIIDNSKYYCDDCWEKKKLYGKL